MAERKIEPLIDIVLATYNGEKFLEQQLESLINQDVPLTYRILAADDGSSDASVAILKRYATLSPRVVLLDDVEKRRGPLERFGWLASQTTAPYIMFCDQDDVWLPDKIENTWKAMQAAESKNPKQPILVHTDLVIVDENLHEIAPSFIGLRGIDPSPLLPRLLVENPVTGCTVMVNRALLKLALPFPATVYMHDWWLALIAKTCGSLVYLPEKTICYRQHGSNTVGIRRVGLLERVRRFWKIWGDQSAQKMYDFSYTQAKVLLMRAKPYMRLDAQITVESFVSASEAPTLKKRWRILRGGFLQKNPLRQVMLLLRIR